MQKNSKYQNKLKKNYLGNRFDNFIYKKIKHIKNPKILEFGVQDGYSTKKFIKIIKKNGGNLFSVDVNDCGNISKNKKWKFIHSRDDNFDKIKKNIPKKLDVIFFDSFHESTHVNKIIYYYYDFLSKGGLFFIDDISWLPYTKNSWAPMKYAEINNHETYQMILQIFHANYDNFDLEVSFVDSGYVLLRKLNNKNLLPSKKIRLNTFTLKNNIKKIFNFFNLLNFVKKIIKIS